MLSVIYRKLIHQRPLVTWGVTALVLFMAVILHASLDAWVQGVYYAGTREGDLCAALHRSELYPADAAGRVERAVLRDQFLS